YHVGQAVAVHVPRPGHAVAGIPIILEAAQGEAADPQRVERDGRPATVHAAEDDVRLAAVVPADVGGIRPDEHIGEAVSIHVPRPAHAVAGILAILEAAQGEAAGPQCVERDGGAAQGAAAEDDVGLAAVDPAGVRLIRPDDKVGEAVTVHVPRTAHA